jgi:hypothetical protein
MKLKQKNPPPSGSGLINFVNKSEPNYRAAQPQRVQQQVQIQMTVHAWKHTTGLPSRQMLLCHPMKAA